MEGFGGVSSVENVDGQVAVPVNGSVVLCGAMWRSVACISTSVHYLRCGCLYVSVRVVDRCAREGLGSACAETGAGAMV